MKASARVLFTQHAIQRRDERGILVSDVLEVLETGYHEKRKDEYKVEFKSWNYAICGKTFEDDELRIAVYFDNDLLMIVVTVIGLDSKNPERRKNGKKIAKKYMFEGFGFPVRLVNVPMIKTRGEWVLDIDYNKLQKEVLVELATKSITLTGNEIRFIRKYFRKTLEAFGKELGVTHVAVLDWEKAGEQTIKINPATEKCLR
ncbi:MAG TPA: DUF4258 domain-containing protein, partial [Chlamydiales bacterium]|nr:DUF4258 domain-containing protein [Chlamydiales bacterium]